jgi:3-oxoacyl-[acyl-carrier protein] reductase
MSLVWDETLNVDLTGVLRTFRAALPHMQDGGAMVAISARPLPHQ